MGDVLWSAVLFLLVSELTPTSATMIINSVCHGMRKRARALHAHTHVTTAASAYRLPRPPRTLTCDHVHPRFVHAAHAAPQGDIHSVQRSSQLAQQVSRANCSRANRLRTELSDTRTELHKTKKQVGVWCCSLLVAVDGRLCGTAQCFGHWSRHKRWSLHSAVEPWLNVVHGSARVWSGTTGRGKQGKDQQSVRGCVVGRCARAWRRVMQDQRVSGPAHARVSMSAAVHSSDPASCAKHAHCHTVVPAHPLGKSRQLLPSIASI